MAFGDGDACIMTEDKRDPAASGMLDKGLLVLNQILADHGGRPLAQISQELGIPLSTVHRLTKTLERHGFLIRATRGHFLPGMVLTHLGSGYPLNEVLRQVSRPPLRTLARQTGHAAHLGVFESDMVTYLVKEAAPKTRLFTREAMQLEAYCSGIGKVLLASLPIEDRNAYLAGGPFVSLTATTITDVEDLRAELRAIAVRGYAIDDAEVADGLRCVAVPLWHDGNVIAALSLSSMAEVLDASFVESSLVALRTCARQIEAKLGTADLAPRRGA